jgi:hypothetical protein
MRIYTLRRITSPTFTVDGFGVAVASSRRRIVDRRQHDRNWRSDASGARSLDLIPAYGGTI